MTSGKAGYSLFEVLVAFAIMTMVLATLLPGQARLLGRTGNIDEQILAQDYAQSILDQVGVLAPATPGVSEHTYREWTVTQNVTMESTETGTNDILRFTVVVSDMQGNTLGRADSFEVLP